MLRKSISFILLLWSVSTLWAQSFKVDGTVMGSDDKQPLIGVGVLVKGGTSGTITDVDGRFSMNARKGDVLVISYMGYKSIEQRVDRATTLRLEMQPDNIMLDEFVAVGYGSMKKSDLTGAVSSIKADKLQNTPSAGLDQALQGRAAGVTVTANSGQPGSEATIRIRGIGTVNGSSPIYVVDGIIVSDIKFLSPSDIESTEILKDASATAIYGSRGANGVILVTTKKGTSGRTRISFDAYFGVQNRWRKIDLMKSKEFAQTIINLNNVNSEKNYYNSRGFNSWLKAYRLGNSPYYPSVYSTTNKNGFNYSEVETDWQEEVFRPAPVQNYSLSVEGGNDKGNYAMSASYFNQEGTVIGSDYQRLTLRVNSSYQVKSWLKVGENLSFMTSTGRNAMNNSASPGASILSAAIAMAPWDPTHYPAGSVNGEGRSLGGQIAASSNFRNVVNPFSMVQNSHPQDEVERWVGDVFVELTPLKGLNLRSSVSMDLSNNRNRLFKDQYLYSDYDKADKNYISSNMSRYCTLIMQNILTYSASFGKHDLSAMVGQTTEQYDYYSTGGAGARILNPIPSNWYLSQATEDRTFASDGVDRSRMFSLLGRVHYTFDKRYLLTVNFRADASSKFPQNLWGYFPSTALAWRISEEPFMKEFSNLDNLKLRIGWGQIGNDKIGGGSFVTKMFNTGPTFVDYAFGPGGQQLASGATVLTYANKNGKWETTEQFNAAVDFGFWNGLLSGSVDFFMRNTRDMLLSVKAPAQVGNRYDPMANVGTVRNTGLELTLDHVKKFGDFSHNISGNVSFVRNELTALNGGERVLWDYQICDQGLPLFSFYGYKYEGLYHSDAEANQHLWGYESANPYHAGDARYADLNNDGKIDDGDKTTLGNPFPWLTYGLNYGLTYKGFDAQLFFQGVVGSQIYNALRIRTEGRGTEATLSTSMRDAWSAANPNGSIPNPYGSSNNTAASSRFVEDGSYLRLKNVQVGYTLPQSLTQKATINRCRFYVSANNLLTFTRYTGYDPEVGGGVDYGNYPQALTVMLGVNLEF